MNLIRTLCILAACFRLLYQTAPAAPGNLDTTFSGDGKVTTFIGGPGTSVAVQNDGRIVVAGFSDAAGTDDFALVRFRASGLLDSTFGTGGKVITPIGSGADFADSVAVQNDGMIVVAGTAYIGNTANFALVRYTSSGVLDSSFGTGGKVTTDFGSTIKGFGRSVSVQNDGKIVVAGYSISDGSGSDFALAAC